jgi:hypothetical protein
MKKILSIAAAAIFTISASMAGAGSKDGADARIRTFGVSHYGKTCPYSQSNSALFQIYREFDRGLLGLDADDLALADKLAQAELRGQLIGRMLRFDLDSDFAVSEKEVRVVISRQFGAQPAKLANPEAKAFVLARIEKNVRLIMAADKDGDGRLAGSELHSQKPLYTPTQQRQNELREFAGILIKADPNGDGVLHSSEAFDVIDQVQRCGP